MAAAEPSHRRTARIVGLDRVAQELGAPVRNRPLADPLREQEHAFAGRSRDLV